MTQYDAVTQVRPGQLKEDAEALPGIRLMDPAVVAPTFENQQQLRGYYTFPDVLDVDRYIIDGKETDAVVAAREIDYQKLPDQNWNNLHTVYTHGYGLVAAYGNRRSSSGDPVWIEKNIPPEGALPDYEGRIYFGEYATTFAIVGREEGQPAIEFDSPGGVQAAGEVNNTYAGAGGVPMGDLFTRLLYAAHFMDLNILLSDRVNSQSKILYDRTPKERVAQVAPWLTARLQRLPGGRRQPAGVDRRRLHHQPELPEQPGESLQATTNDAQSNLVGTQVDQTVNYLRNSVKAVVDAYDGSVDLYAWEEATRSCSPTRRPSRARCKPRSAISADLLAHLRYPEDLFKVQRRGPDPLPHDRPELLVPAVRPVAGAARPDHPDDPWPDRRGDEGRPGRAALLPVDQVAGRRGARCSARPRSSCPTDGRTWPPTCRWWPRRPAPTTGGCGCCACPTPSRSTARARR